MIPTAEQCRDMVVELQGLIKVGLCGLKSGPTREDIRDRIHDLLKQLVLKYDSDDYSVDINLRDCTWGDVYADPKECAKKIAKASWLRFWRRPVPFDTPKDRIVIDICVLPRVLIQGARGTISTNLVAS
jgi:hypothetical protein